MQQGQQAHSLLRRHLHEALTALHGVVEAQPRCAALLASKAALAPLLHCILPFCRRASQALCMPGSLWAQHACTGLPSDMHADLQAHIMLLQGPGQAMLAHARAQPCCTTRMPGSWPGMSC